MKKAFGYSYIIMFILCSFMGNINVSSYQYINENNRSKVSSIKDYIYQITEEYYLTLENDDSSSKFGTYSGSLCPNGITVTGYGTVDFEKYVAGVVAHEAFLSAGFEALKAQAIAARTYALNYTNYCQRPIGNSTAAQTFSSDPPAKAVEAAQATAGQILTYNGKIFSSQYDSFCYDDSDCRDATKTASGYTVTYTKVPSNEKHQITLSDSSLFGSITHGQGHAHGMSQLLSYQMAKEGKTYDEILTYFYATGVEIVRPMSISNWKQYDEPWGAFELGDGELTKMGKIGCLVTSAAIVIAQAGVQTPLGNNFNPGTFAEYLKRMGAFSSGGGLKSGYVERVVNVSITPEHDYSASNIESKLLQGKQVIVKMALPSDSNSTHFMAVSGVEDGKVLLSDPGGTCTVLGECKTNKVPVGILVYTFG